MKNYNSKNSAFNLILATILISLLSILAISSASSLKSNQLYHHSYYFVYKQIIGICLGFFIIYITYNFCSFRLIEKCTLPLLFIGFLLLSLIYVPGVFQMVGGAKRWINIIPGLRFQPAEFAKISFIFFLAKNLSRPSIHIRNFTTGILPNLIFLALLSLFLLKQPDFGSLALIFLVTFLMLFVAGIKKSDIFITFTVSICFCLYSIFSTPYRITRLISYLNPWDNVSGSGFQIIQSYLAFHNGKIIGLGLGLSKQKFIFLPEAHTDFILAVIAEETGLLGIITIFSIFTFIIFTGLQITIKEKNQHRKFLSFGLTILIASQTFFNIGVVTGLLPTKGISLPLVSCGVSSLLAFLFAIGILAKISQLQQDEPTHVKTI